MAIASNGSFWGWTRTLTDPRLHAAIVDPVTFGGNITETGTTFSWLAHARTQRASGCPPIRRGGLPALLVVPPGMSFDSGTLAGVALAGSEVHPVPAKAFDCPASKGPHGLLPKSSSPARRRGLGVSAAGMGEPAGGHPGRCGAGRAGPGAVGEHSRTPVGNEGIPNRSADESGSAGTGPRRAARPQWRGVRGPVQPRHGPRMAGWATEVGLRARRRPAGHQRRPVSLARAAAFLGPEHFVNRHGVR